MNIIKSYSSFYSKSVSLVVILFHFFSTYSQLVTTGGQSPANLVQNVLLGPGVQVSNVSYYGSNQAIGRFNGANTNVGFTEGIIITTGTIQNNGNGPHGPNNSPSATFDNGFGGYSRLSNLVGGQTYNAAVLEFDFIPFSDTVSFRYVFGSEEYMEYVGSQFNDVFAFFISGPGIPGGIQNMARLPNGNVVAINNVNNGTNNTGPCMNCNQYVYNGTGSNAPYNQNPYYVQYDGLTKPLEAKAKVICGEKYHLIIAIADVQDALYDSGIFLEANSLQTRVPVSIEYNLSYSAFADPSVMAEGCVSATFKLTRNNNLNQALTIPISVSGSATMGVDYTSIPTSVTFQPGQSVVQFTFSALQDNIVEGIENILIEFAIPDPCNGSNTQTVELKIDDVNPLQVMTNDTIANCPGEVFELIANISGGVGPYTYLWSTGDTTSSIFVNPLTTTAYTVSVTDFCLGETVNATLNVVIPVRPPISLQTSGNIVEICPYVPRLIQVFPSGGSGMYVFEWYDEAGNRISFSDTVTVTPSQSTVYSVVVRDNCGDSAKIDLTYTITSPPLLLQSSPTQIICPGDSVRIWVTSTGGYGQHYYYWPHNGSTSNAVFVNPSQTTQYIVRVSDECQTFFVYDTITVVVSQPIANFQVVSNLLFNNVAITFENLSQNAVQYQWFFGDGNQSTLVHPNNTYINPGDYYITLIAINQIGCKDTIVKPLIVMEEYYIYAPNTFTPDGNRYNHYFSVSTLNVIELNIQIFNRWGELIFESSEIDFEWDGSYEGMMSPDGMYAYKLNYLSKSGIRDTIYGHVNLLR